MWVREISGMYMTTGFSGSEANSVDMEPVKSQHDARGLPEGRLEGSRTRKVYNVACPLDHCKLESKANAKKGSILLACPFDRQYQTFDAALTKAAWNEDTAGENMRLLTVITNMTKETLLCPNDSSPCIMIFLRICLLLCWFQIR